MKCAKIKIVRCTVFEEGIPRLYGVCYFTNSASQCAHPSPQDLSGYASSLGGGCICTCLEEEI
jgi:hypothetical protein